MDNSVVIMLLRSSAILVLHLINNEKTLTFGVFAKTSPVFS